MRNRPTIKDVAKRAGVSYQTVSRVINNSQRVSPETQARVNKAIKELGYRPSSIARSMVQGKTFTIGCISPNLTDFVFAKIIDAAQVEARDLGFFMLTVSAQNEEEAKALLEEMLRRRVDGLLILNPREDHRYRHLQPFIKNRIPIVFVKDKAEDMPVSSVTCDGLKGGYQATKYLLSLGHTSIATITGLLNEEDARERLEGYRRTLSEAGIDERVALIRHGDWTEGSGQRAAKRLVESGASFTAIFAQNDRMAMGAIHTLTTAGLSVPGDVSVIGFDDAPFASFIHPPLTTLHQPMGKLGQKAAQLLAKAIQVPDSTPKSVQFTPQLIERHSCKPV